MAPVIRDLLLRQFHDEEHHRSASPFHLLCNPRIEYNMQKKKRNGNEEDDDEKEGEKKCPILLINKKMDQTVSMGLCTSVSLIPRTLPIPTWTRSAEPTYNNIQLLVLLYAYRDRQIDGQIDGQTYNTLLYCREGHGITTMIIRFCSQVLIECCTDPSLSTSPIYKYILCFPYWSNHNAPAGLACPLFSLLYLHLALSSSLSLIFCFFLCFLRFLFPS